MMPKGKALAPQHTQFPDSLISAAPTTQEQVREVHDRIQATLSSEFEASKDYKPAPKDWLTSHWDGFMSPKQLSKIRGTGVPADMLKQVSDPASHLNGTCAKLCKLRLVARAVFCL